MLKEMMAATLLVSPVIAGAQEAAAPSVTFMKAEPAPAVAPAKPVFTQGFANVFRRFGTDLTPKMVDFYDKTLGLRPLQPIQLNANMQMILFGVGGGQIKLAAESKPGRKYHAGGLTDVVGIRSYTLHFADEAALTARFKAAGYPAPAFKALGGGKRGALVKDPGGFTLALVIAPQDTPKGVEVGINVSDLAKSRAFYRNFVGLEELPPVKDALLGVTKYPFRRGETTISLWSVGKNLPADTGSAGIQYVVGNVDAINAAALQQKVAVETPLGGLANFSIRFVWLNDADGVTNYFAQVGPRPAQ